MEFRTLLSQSWQVFRSHLRTFLLLSLIGYAAILAISLIAVYMISPAPNAGPRNIPEVWNTMSASRKVGIFVCGFAILEVFNRIHAAAIMVLREMQADRDHGPIRALCLVREKHLRLFWVLELLSWFPPFIQGPVIALFLSAAYPVSVVEDLGVRHALARSAALRKDGLARIALLFLISTSLYLGVLAVFFLITSSNDQIPSGVFSGIGFCLALLVGQWYMIVLTVNYFDQRRRLGELPSPSDGTLGLA
jgi:hypothetical protein